MNEQCNAPTAGAMVLPRLGAYSRSAAMQTTSYIVQHDERGARVALLGAAGAEGCVGAAHERARAGHGALPGPRQCRSNHSQTGVGGARRQTPFVERRDATSLLPPPGISCQSASVPLPQGCWGELERQTPFVERRDGFICSLLLLNNNTRASRGVSGPHGPVKPSKAPTCLPRDPL